MVGEEVDVRRARAISNRNVMQLFALARTLLASSHHESRIAGIDTLRAATAAWAIHYERFVEQEDLTPKNP